MKEPAMEAPTVNHDFVFKLSELEMKSAKLQRESGKREIRNFAGTVSELT